MTVKEKLGKMTTTRVDQNTLNRFKVLSGEKPVARYLRELSVTLTEDNPPSLDELRGGESLTPIKRQLDDLTKVFFDIQKDNWQATIKMAARLGTLIAVLEDLVPIDTKAIDQVADEIVTAVNEDSEAVIKAGHTNEKEARLDFMKRAMKRSNDIGR